MVRFLSILRLYYVHSFCLLCMSCPNLKVNTICTIIFLLWLYPAFQSTARVHSSMFLGPSFTHAINLTQWFFIVHLIIDIKHSIFADFFLLHFLTTCLFLLFSFDIIILQSDVFSEYTYFCVTRSRTLLFVIIEICHLP